MQGNNDGRRNVVCEVKDLDGTDGVKYPRNSRSQSYNEQMLHLSMKQLPDSIMHCHGNNNNNNTNTKCTEEKVEKETKPQPEFHYKRLKSCGQLQSALVTLAIQEGDTNQLWRLLARKDVDINEVDGIGMQPIHYACIYGELEILKILLQEGGHIDTPTVKGDYPLDIAVSEGNFEVAQYLISRGARVKSVVNGILYKSNRRRTLSAPEEMKKQNLKILPHEI